MPALSAALGRAGPCGALPQGLRAAERWLSGAGDAALAAYFAGEPAPAEAPHDERWLIADSHYCGRVLSGRVQDAGKVNAAHMQDIDGHGCVRSAERSLRPHPWP